MCAFATGYPFIGLVELLLFFWTTKLKHEHLKSTKSNLIKKENIFVEHWFREINLAVLSKRYEYW